MISGRAYLWVALALLGLIAADGTCAKDMDWPEAVGRLTRERSLAETCAATPKGHGGPQEISQGQLAYGEAKSSFDAAIAGPITALSEGEPPKALPALQADLERRASELQAFCKAGEPKG